MSAMRSASARPAISAGHTCTMCMPFSMHPTCMAATPYNMIIETGVLASVSLFVLLHIVTTPLLVSLVVLSLILISLTGLRGLVGLTVGQDTSAAQGD
jgi:hypothetical protein